MAIYVCDYMGVKQLPQLHKSTDIQSTYIILQ